MLRCVTQIPPLYPQHSFSRCPESTCGWLTLSYCLSTALSQTSCLIQDYISFWRAPWLVNSWIQTKVWPLCLNLGTLRKADPLSHLHANLHPRVCFMKNPAFFPKQYTWSMIVLCSGFLGTTLETLGSLLPSPLLKETYGNTGKLEWHYIPKTTKKLE